MKLHYYPEADSFCIELKGVSGVETLAKSPRACWWN